jgi:hypothetical protein
MLAKKTAKKSRKPAVKKPAPKKVVVNRKFLLDLADHIYNPKTKTFLRLCNGTLQNGPDPTDSKRPMHCGLGELYLEMTGHQPEADGVSESQVIDKAVELGPFAVLENATVEKARAGIKALKLPKHIETAAILNIDEELANRDEGEITDFADKGERKFREALDLIPNKNDDGCDDEVCTDDRYGKRSARVAKQLRKAAALLPA